MNKQEWLILGLMIMLALIMLIAIFSLYNVGLALGIEMIKDL